MSETRGSRVVVVAIAACAAAGLAAYLLTTRRKSKRQSSAGTLALATVEGLTLYKQNLPRRLFLAPFVSKIQLSSVSPSLGHPIDLEPLLIFRNLSSLDLSNNGLVVFPPCILQIKTLKSLNLSRNKLSKIPADISKLSQLIDLDLGRNELDSVPPELGSLSSLKTLNLMANKLTSLPETIGGLKNVFRLGLKSNRLRALPESIGEMESLVELFITDNLLTTLPPSMGKLTKLFKLQASFNKLELLPAEMGSLPTLELFRIAVNNLASLPASFARLDRLAWFSLAGNPACGSLPKARKGLRKIKYKSLKVGEKLGDGASGDVFAAKWTDGEEEHDVVFKQFKAETSPDGHSRDEVAISASLDHPNLTYVVGLVDNPKGMVLTRVYARSMAEKPNFDSLLRCRWDPASSFSFEFVISVAKGISSALEYLHSKGICHGDVYAHNILATPQGQAILCDFGASFCYSPADAIPFEAHEVRAFGLFLNDLHRLTKASSASKQAREELHAIARKCTDTQATDRPQFRDVTLMLSALA